jgi:hypothetical protein
VKLELPAHNRREEALGSIIEPDNRAYTCGAELEARPYIIYFYRFQPIAGTAAACTIAQYQLRFVRAGYGIGMRYRVAVSGYLYATVIKVPNKRWNVGKVGSKVDCKGVAAF